MKSIFVSSTFRDMNFERDIINKKITPKINHMLMQYNQSIRVVDLRWGVDTSSLSEEAATEYVLRKCNSYIDSCKPYIVVLLGDRYGWIPEKEKISVTHMEILHGVIESSDRDHVYIYFRKADYSNMPEEYRAIYTEQNDAGRIMLEDLKSCLLAEMPDRCREYSATWSEQDSCLVSADFEDLLIHDLEDDLVTGYTGRVYKSELQKQLDENKYTLEENRELAYSDVQKIGNVVEKIKASSKPFCLVGEGGAGKSVYMSLLCSALQRENKHAVILFCGDNAFSASVRNAAETLLYAICTACGEEYDFETGSNLSYHTIISQIEKKRRNIRDKIYFMLDAVEKCDREMIDLINWCNIYLKKEVVVVLSARDPEELGIRGSVALLSIEYDQDEFMRMASQIFNTYCKEVRKTQILQDVVEKCDTPLQLKLNISMLVNWGAQDYGKIQKLGNGMDAINSYLKQTIDSIPESGLEQVKYYFEKLTEEDDSSLAELLLMILMHCPYGLSEDGLREITERIGYEWVELEYLDFLERFAFFIRIGDNGRMYISHDVVKDALLEKFGIFGNSVAYAVISYFMSKEPQDVFTMRSFFASALCAGFSESVPKYICDKRKYFDPANNDPEESAMGEKMRDFIRQLYFGGGRQFFLDSFDTCSDQLEYARMHQALSVSLFSMEGFYPESDIMEAAYDIANLYWQIPFFQAPGLKNFENSIKLNCVEMLKKRRVSKQKVEEFERFWDGHARQSAAEFGVEETGGSNSNLLTMDELYSILNDMDKISGTVEGAEKCIDILSKISIRLDNCELQTDLDNYYLSYSNIYKKMIDAYKTLEDVVKCEEYCLRNIEIYQQAYSIAPTANSFKDYCYALFNYAAIIEWRAIKENDLKLMEKAIPIFEEIYEKFSILVSTGCQEEMLTNIASSIILLGTCLCIVGRVDEGTCRLLDAIGIVRILIENTPFCNIKVDISEQILAKCVEEVFIKVDEETFRKRTCAVCEYIKNIVENEKALHIFVIKSAVRLLATMSGIAKQASASNDIDSALKMNRLMFEVSDAILPIYPFSKSNMIVSRTNYCTELFAQGTRYEKCLEKAEELLDITLEKGLADPDENGRYDERAVNALLKCYVLCFICLDRLGREEELVARLLDSEKWADFFAKRIEAMQGNTPGLLLDIYETLKQSDIKLCGAVIYAAIEASKKPTFDAEAHRATAMAIKKFEALLDSD